MNTFICPFSIKLTITWLFSYNQTHLKRKFSEFVLLCMTNLLHSLTFCQFLIWYEFLNALDFEMNVNVEF